MTQIEAACLVLVLTLIGIILACGVFMAGLLVRQLRQLNAWVGGRALYDAIMEDRR